ncbi:MAG: RtcB family protein [bacterium]
MSKFQGKLEKIDEYRWRIPRSHKGGMRTDGVIYASEKMLPHIIEDNTPEQVANSACLPGIHGPALAMPDIHWGYGLPIGGVVATDAQDGVISPGGVGSDINCGVRLVRTDLEFKEVEGHIKEITDLLYRNIPCGVGSKGDIKLSDGEMKKMLRDGAKWAVERGYGWESDLEATEERGALPADPSVLSEKVLARGRGQLGTLGAGNHFLEVQVVDKIYNHKVAQAFGLWEGQITVMIHSGSRGLGYQVCDDYMRFMRQVMEKYHISLPDRQLACAPINSPEGQEYLQAMACAANYAWANRQIMMHLVRKSFEEYFGRSAEKLRMDLLYDVCHNIAKFEEYPDESGNKRLMCIHRKGATRSLAPGSRALSPRFMATGQPVIIPGDMGTASYVLVGAEGAMKETFGSTAHGAGRMMGRNQAIKSAEGRSIVRELEDQGIYVHAREPKSLAEEMPEAYKDVDDVVSVVHNAGLSTRVARMKPLGVVKG